MEIWNKWREEESVGKPDLAEADLYHGSLSEVNLVKANLTGANLQNVDLIRANLRGADLKGSSPERPHRQGRPRMQSFASRSVLSQDHPAGGCSMPI